MSGIVGLYPGLAGIGGVEESGRATLPVIGDYPGGGRVLCCDLRRGAAIPGIPDAVFAGSKASAVVAALRHSWSCDTVLVWHLGLLKLVPLLRVPRARVVQFLHGIEGWRRLGGIERHLLRRVDLFLTNSRWTWKRFLSFNPEFRQAEHRVVPLGLGEPDRDPPHGPASEPTMLIVGRAMRSESYSKGHRELIECWPRVLAAIPGAMLCMIGPGDLNPDLAERAEALGISGNLRIAGAVSEEEKGDLLRACRALALPSGGEGFGLVYLEAMRAARPCLVGDSDAGREVVNPPEAGLSANPKDPQALAEAARELLTPGPEWNRRSPAAKSRYESHYTAEQFRLRLRDSL